MTDFLAGAKPVYMGGSEARTLAVLATRIPKSCPLPVAGIAVTTLPQEKENSPPQLCLHRHGFEAERRRRYGLPTSGPPARRFGALVLPVQQP